MVGVRTDNFSMGSSIDVTIKSPEVDFDEAKKIAKAHDRIDRDHFGEILSGCNRYVSVDYTGECRRLMGEPFEDRIIDAFVALDGRGPTNVHEEVKGTGITLSLENPHSVRIWDGHRARGSFYGMTPGGIKDGAFQVALLDREMKREERS